MRRVSRARVWGLVAAAVIAIGGPCAAEVAYRLIGTVQSPGMGGSLSDIWAFQAVSTRNGYIYALTRSDQLIVFDGTSLNGDDAGVALDSPIAQVALDGLGGMGMLIVGSRLYVYGWSGGWAFDLADPTRPERSGRLGGEDLHILDLEHHRGYLVAACEDRIRLYSFAFSVDYPSPVTDLLMDEDTTVYEVCVVDDALCAVGYRRRWSGTYDYWFGVWDFGTPRLAELRYVIETEARGYVLACMGDRLLAVSEGDVTLWGLDDDDGPHVIDQIDVCGRSVAVHANDVVLSGGGLKVNGDSLEVLWAHSCPLDGPYTGQPFDGAADEDLMILPTVDSLFLFHCGDGP